jgi:hypothetical protein
VLKRQNIAAIIALTTILTLLVPGAAYATNSTKVPVGGNAAIWVEENPPKPHTIDLQAALITPQASGGGCRNTGEIGVCISYRRSASRLEGDFYRNYVEAINAAWARLYIYVSGVGFIYEYSTPLDHLGHYPAAYQPVGSGFGFTTVDIYQSDGTYLFTGNSPVQYYP